jgi:hypothetical protein
LTVLFQDSSAEIKTIKPSIRIAGNTAEIWTRYLLNTALS